MEPAAVWALVGTHIRRTLVPFLVRPDCRCLIEELAFAARASPTTVRVLAEHSLHCVQCGLEFGDFSKLILVTDVTRIGILHNPLTADVMHAASVGAEQFSELVLGHHATHVVVCLAFA